MKARKTTLAFGITLALGAFPALAVDFWQATNDESGSAIALPTLGAVTAIAPAPATAPLAKGAFSPDREYVYFGGEGGWQLRPMQYAFDGGSLVHVDDPVGHMSRVADNRALTPAKKAGLERSGGV